MAMRTMTEDQAELFIRAGYFPKANDVEAIVDLQDVFGHQRMWAIYKWLYNEDTYQNALTLYKLIWHPDDVERFLKQVNQFVGDENDLADLDMEIKQLEENLARLEKARHKLARKISCFHKSMNNEE